MRILLMSGCIILFNMLIIVTMPLSAYSEEVIDAQVYIEPNDGLPIIVVNGTITKNTVEDLKRLLIRLKKTYIYGGTLVRLNSLGGNVDAAIEAGYLLRKYTAHVAIPSTSTCASACVFLLAGATSRGVDGNVGIHRPYEPNDNIKSASKQKEKYNALGKKIKKFFTYVNIPGSLYDEMLRIAPHSVKYLSKADLSRTGLGEDDPYFAEAKSSKCADDLGVSKQEFERRMNLWNTVCSKYDEEKRSECIKNIYQLGHE